MKRAMVIKMKNFKLETAAKLKLAALKMNESMYINERHKRRFITIGCCYIGDNNEHTSTPTNGKDDIVEQGIYITCKV